MRNQSIDLLRGIATVAMILIHTSYYFIGGDKIALFIWNWSQFAVPMFVFCAGYVFFIKDRIKTLNDFSVYLKKRLPRLLIPYWIFMLFFFAIYWAVNHALSFNYIWQSVVVIGGIDIDWLVLLMIELAVLLPVIKYLQNKNLFLFKVYIVLNILLALAIFYIHFNVNYKLIMWYFWGLSGISSMLILPDIKPKLRNAILILAFLIFVGLFIQGLVLHHDLSFINNKYPPNLFIISYGLITCLGLYYLAERGVFNYLLGPLSFISSHSYSIYFVHYSLLIFFASFLNRVHLTWYIFFTLILGLTLIIQWTYSNKLVNRVNKLKF